MIYSIYIYIYITSTTSHRKRRRFFFVFFGALAHNTRLKRFSEPWNDKSSFCGGVESLLAARLGIQRVPNEWNGLPRIPATVLMCSRLSLGSTWCLYISTRTGQRGNRRSNILGFGTFLYLHTILAYSRDVFHFHFLPWKTGFRGSLKIS